jgi:hypothetical protein
MATAHAPDEKTPRAVSARRRPAALLVGFPLLAAALAAMVWREPAYLRAPSFFAEEGNVYFVHAWMDPWPRALLGAPSGYFLLFTNVAVLLAARAVPLVWSPYVTTLLSLSVQMLPVVLIAFAAAPEWRSPRRKVLGVAIVLFASLSDEIWLNTINSQGYFAVAVALVLLEPAALSAARTWTYAALLLLAGASGPVAAAAAPLFALKALLFRRRAAWVLAGAMATALAVQLATVLATAGGEYIGRRGSGLTLASASLLLWMRTVILPLFGVGPATRFGHAMFYWLGGNLASRTALAVGLALDAAAAAMLAWLCRPLGARQRIALGGGFALTASVVVVLASGPQISFLTAATYSSRYFYAPGVVLLLLLLANASDRRPRASAPRRLVCSVLLAIALVLGADRYRSTVRWQPSWPLWRQQVDAWERDPYYALQIWPQGWKIGFLPRRTPTAPR